MTDDAKRDDGDHTIENAEEQGGGGYGGPFPVEPEQEQTGGDAPEGDAPADDAGAGDADAGDADEA